MNRTIDLRSFESIEQAVSEINRTNNGALVEFRKTAIENLKNFQFKDTLGEDWKYTDSGYILDKKFKLPADETDEKSEYKNERTDEYTIKLVNGNYTAISSKLEKSDGINVSFHKKSNSGRDIYKQIGSISGRKKTSFSELNSAMAEVILILDISENVTAKKPVRIVHQFTETENTIYSPRIFIDAGEGSSIDIIEDYYGTPGNDSFINSITEIKAGKNSKINYYRLEREKNSVFSTGSQYFSVKSGAKINSNLSLFGSPLSRNEVYCYLDGEEAESNLHAIYMLDKKQHADNHTEIFHNTSNSSSSETYHGILDGESRAVFDGLIYVARGADGTNSNQSNKSLLLSDSARVDSKPSLEIYAEDVKCSHSATVGKMDEDSLFYLQSRGIPAEKATKILTRGFAGEIINRFSLGSMKEISNKLLSEKLG